MNNNFNLLKNNVIDRGLCTHCGLCSGLSEKSIEMIDTDRGPIPTSVADKNYLDPIVLDACPGKGLHYPELNKNIFNKIPDNWLIGNYMDLFIGYSKNEKVRSKGASGGIISQALIYLLESKMISGAITVKMGKIKPWEAEPQISKNKKEVLECSQSVYAPVPILKILDEIEEFDGDLAMVGLPDQIAAIRFLKQKNHPIAKKIKYFIGPYVGTNMYFESIRGFLRSEDINEINEIKTLKYRDGEWPGYLSIVLKNGRRFKLEKFYYNYLIPFYITKSSLISVDFTNELTDISVGDAWNPKYEKIGKGFSVVISRSENGKKILNEMQKKNLINLERIDEKEAIKMHAHMIEFKKRGSFIRMKFLRMMGKKTPVFGYEILKIPVSRYIIELFMSTMFLLSSSMLGRKISELIPKRILGPSFNFFRKNWKRLTKKSKRKGLLSFEYKIINE